MTIYTVNVYDRYDGIYCFATEHDANRFADAVESQGGSVSVESQTVCDSMQADFLIAAELSE